MKKKFLLAAVMCVVLALCGLMVACDETEPEMRTVTYAAGETAATGTAPVQADVAEGSEFTVADNTFVNPGYTFAGWTEGKTFYEAGASYRVGKQNVTLTAKWLENDTFSVSYAPGAGGGEFIETATPPPQKSRAARCLRPPPILISVSVTSLRAGLTVPRFTLPERTLLCPPPRT